MPRQPAIDAAEAIAPIQNRGKLAQCHMEKIAQLTGARMSQRAAKEALVSATAHRKLIYLKATRHRQAGYYPPGLGRPICTLWTNSGACGRLRPE